MLIMHTLKALTITERTIMHTINSLYPDKMKQEILLPVTASHESKFAPLHGSDGTLP